MADAVDGSATEANAQLRPDLLDVLLVEPDGSNIDHLNKKKGNVILPVVPRGFQFHKAKMAGRLWLGVKVVAIGSRCYLAQKL